ncbi:hypothetical protein GCM10009746_22500 [Microbacterium paludicola]
MAAGSGFLRAREPLAASGFEAARLLLAAWFLDAAGVRGMPPRYVGPPTSRGSDAGTAADRGPEGRRATSVRPGPALPTCEQSERVAERPTGVPGWSVSDVDTDNAPLGSDPASD